MSALRRTTCIPDSFPVRFGFRPRIGFQPTIRQTSTIEDNQVKTHPAILVVDDDPISMAIVALLLHSEDFSVLRANNGYEALQVLEACRSQGEMPPTVLVDLHMPGVNGFELARECAHAKPRPRLVAMSATKVDPSRLRDFDDFLLKPIDLDLLRAALTGNPGRLGSARALPLAQALAAPALDPCTLTKLRAIMPPEAIRELYTTYVSDTRTRIAELERCTRTGDAEGARRCAHMLKGSAAMAGVQGIAGIAAAFESGTAAKMNHKSLFHELRIACDDVEQAMTQRASEE
jgi:two-component system, sensor histidine kinase and response regulator